MDIINFIIKYRHWSLSQKLMRLYGFEIPATVKIGGNFSLVHSGVGTIIHPRTVIGENVRIFHQVTIGRADAHIPFEESRMESIIIEDDVIIFPGAKILAGAGVTKISRGTIIGANSVLLGSTKENEIWAGVPAKVVGTRE